MVALEVPEPEARRIAEAAADWVDSDSVTGPGGAEDEAYAAGPAPLSNRAIRCSPIRARCTSLAGMTPDIYARLRPWLCAPPTSALSPLNVNTLGLDQAPLLAMLAPGQMGLDRARAVLARRPSAGWNNQVEFWRTEAMSEAQRPARRAGAAAAEDQLVHAGRARPADAAANIGRACWSTRACSLRASCSAAGLTEGRAEAARKLVTPTGIEPVFSP